MSLPVATWEGAFTLFGVRLRRYTLDDGQRIINAGDFAELVRVTELGGPIIDAVGDAEAFARWHRGVDTISVLSSPLAPAPSGTGSAPHGHADPTKDGAGGVSRNE
jgi:hypothetical protein